MDSQEMYKQAYRAHYYEKNYNYALIAYLDTLASFPDSDEARYSKQQILNLKDIMSEADIDLDEELMSLYQDICNEQNIRAQREKERIEEYAKEQENQRQKLEEIEKRFSNLLLTTGNNFDGYIVEKYIDVLCEEIVFRNGFLTKLDAGIDNIVDSLSFKDAEFSGSGKTISNARELALKKLKRKAVQLGANAILGMEFGSSFGVPVVRVAVSGTAVRIKPINE